ncbi:MAG: hypothetical protein VKO44_06195 [Cyanobacteriota bacterium]|nr:hypothetical protein [Cyanobacteriota bacterium]
MAGFLATTGIAVSAPAHASWAECTSTSSTGYFNTFMFMGMTIPKLSAGAACTVGDKKITILEQTMNAGADSLAGNVSFTSTSAEQHTLTGQSSQFLGTGKFYYSVEVTSTEKMKSFNFLNQTSLNMPFDYSFTTKLYDTASATIPFFTSSGTENGPNAPLTMVPLSPNLSYLRVEHDYTQITGNGMQQFTDTIIQTPGPLPLLGVGTAFGFSRKLRRRVQLSAR